MLATFRADPYPFYAMLRQQGAVVYLERLRAWNVVGYAEALEALRTPAHSRPTSIATRAARGPVRRTSWAWIPRATRSSAIS